MRRGGLRLRGDDGLTSVEYGILAAFIGIAFIVAGPTLAEAFVDVLDAVLDSMGVG